MLVDEKNVNNPLNEHKKALMANWTKFETRSKVGVMGALKNLEERRERQNKLREENSKNQTILTKPSQYGQNKSQANTAAFGNKLSNPTPTKDNNRTMEKLQKEVQIQKAAEMLKQNQIKKGNKPTKQVDSSDDSSGSGSSSTMTDSSESLVQNLKKAKPLVSNVRARTPQTQNKTPKPTSQKTPQNSRTATPHKSASREKLSSKKASPKLKSKAVSSTSINKNSEPESLGKQSEYTSFTGSKKYIPEDTSFQDLLEMDKKLDDWEDGFASCLHFDVLKHLSYLQIHPLFSRQRTLQRIRIQIHT